MKKLTKLLTVLLMIVMVLTLSMGVVNAGSNPEDKVDSLFNPTNPPETTNLENVGANIVDIVTTIGIIAAVVVLLVLGIKYMMGSASEKAEYKKTMIPYLIGAVLIFGASAIAKAVIQMSKIATNS